ncbi:MAG TPA: NUDIX domain-containing protein [Thermomicrobiales bacterium]|nr:NUDIX domain-containing protein [Thermomicrobiales bacterium]
MSSPANPVVVPAQDPDERFDLVTAYGAPLGTSKRRADVHKEGDWHRSIHVWIYGIDPETTEPFVLFQRRGLEKDTWPGMLDATAAGHLSSGETVPDAFREIEEELGIAPDPSRLQHIGTRVCANEQPPTIFDRELQEVFFLREDGPLSLFHPNAAEVDALVRLPLGETLEFLGGFRGDVHGTVLFADDRREEGVTITAECFVPTMIDRYYYRVAIAIAAVLRGDRYIAV